MMKLILIHAVGWMLLYSGFVADKYQRQHRSQDSFGVFLADIYSWFGVILGGVALLGTVVYGVALFMEKL